MPRPYNRNRIPGVMKRGSTWAYVLPYVDTDGKRKQLWKSGFLTQRAAHEARVEEEAQRNKGISIAPSKLTVAAWLERWLSTYAATLEASTAKTYGFNLRRHVIPVLGPKLLKDLRPADVTACYTEIVRSGRSTKTALNVHRVFREALAHAVKLELIGRNVADAIPSPPRPKRAEVRPPSMKEIDSLFAEGDKTAYGLLCRLALHTGLRQGEILRLRWRDVNLDAAQLYVREAKWGSIGTVLLSPGAVALIKAQELAQKEQRLAVGPRFNETGHVFTNAVGREMDAGGLKRTWARIQKKTELATRFHDLRHGFAALMISQGVDVKYLQGQMRHRQISTTLDIYGHLMPSKQRQEAAKIDVALRELAGN